MKREPFWLGVLFLLPLLAFVVADMVRSDLPVNVAWATHPSEPEPFIGPQADKPEELREALRAFEGRALSLAFTPR
jgi:hypothetical protein